MSPCPHPFESDLPGSVGAHIFKRCPYLVRGFRPQPERTTLNHGTAAFSGEPRNQLKAHDIKGGLIYTLEEGPPSGEAQEEAEMRTAFTKKERGLRNWMLDLNSYVHLMKHDILLKRF